MSEEVVTVFRLLGRVEHQTYAPATGEQKRDLLIQPMMVREGSDEVADDFSDIHPVRFRAVRENV